MQIYEESPLAGAAYEVIDIVESAASIPERVTKLLREKFFEYAHGDGKQRVARHRCTTSRGGVRATPQAAR